MNLDTIVKLEAVLDGAVAANQPEVHVHFVEFGPDGEPSGPAVFRVALNSGTDVTILAAPTSPSHRREISEITIFQKDTATRTVTVKTDDGTTERIIIQRAVPPDGTLEYNKYYGWRV